MGRWGKRGLAAWVIATALWTGHAVAKEACLECHEIDSKSQDTSQASLHWLSQSVHEGLGCTDCHSEVDLNDHPSETARAVNCATCHGDIEEQYAQSVHSRKHDQGDTRAPFCYDCHGSHNIRRHDDPLAPSARLNIPHMCANCHSTVQGVTLTHTGEKPPYEAYKNSIHGQLILEQGLEGAAVCSDCHEPHRQLRKFDPLANIFKANVPSTCGQCHGEITKVYERSIHGQAVRAGNFEAPVCNDCHSEHNILPPNDAQSKVYGANISKTTCLDCHKTLQLASDRQYYEKAEFKYRDSYHGAASRAGVVEVANCASCHGIHDILPSTDSASSINKANLPHTCGQCHPQAGENFAQGSVHRWESKEATTPAAWVRNIYIWMIVIVLGGMLAHNALLFGHHLRHRHRPPESGVEYLRFTKGERWQHWILAFVFIGLVITGFAFRFPDSFWARWWVGSAEGFQLRDFLHRLFGGVFGALMLAHIAYIWGTKRGRAVQKHLWPTLDDVTGAWQNVRFHLGLTPDKPRVRGMFDYAEKMEYWALVWGSWVMLLTGVPMWFENWALSFMPRWMLDVSRTIHLYEAILASAAIVIWHFYFVIFDPEYYPLNMSMITGRAHPRDGSSRAPIQADEPADKAADTEKVTRR
jgi:cytochrome b subunit of formate dehydrogenase